MAPNSSRMSAVYNGSEGLVLKRVKLTRCDHWVSLLLDSMQNPLVPFFPPQLQWHWSSTKIWRHMQAQRECHNHNLLKLWQFSLVENMLDSIMATLAEAMHL